LTKIGGKKVGG
jgi:hypothetical protein